MKRISLATLSLWLVLNVSAQKKNDEIALDFYGFIRSEAFVDTYKGLDAAHDVFYLVPLYTGVDSNGKDINEQTSANLSALASRLGVKIEGPVIFNAKTSGTIEFDFGGIVRNEPTLFRIRHAHVNFLWDKTKLLVGQTWHPFWGGGVYPTVSGLNTGAPFQAFNRSPQIRFDYFVSDKITLSGSAVYENQYTSRYFDASNYSTPNQAQRNGVIPEMIASAEYQSKRLTLGAGTSLKRIKPKMMVSGESGDFVSSSFLTSTSIMSYAKFKTNLLSITTKAYYGQNMTHLTMLGGYGISAKDIGSGEETYTNYNSFSSLLNVVYGKKWQAGLLLAYAENLGTTDPLVVGQIKEVTAGLLANVQNHYRIAPHIALNISKIRLVGEYEITSANFGTGNFNYTDGLYSQKHKATNNRFEIMMMYFF